MKDTGATVLFATDTFLNQYARSAEPGELSGLTFVVCGAEKVREETHNLIADKFGPIPILEGYGATEASPVIAVNKPTDNRRGTVGGLLPGVEARLEPVEGIPGGGKLLVRGPNIMAGYLNAAGGIDPPDGGWHDTGDVVSLGDDDWIKILGRVKRFAKIGGEMVSLTAAEDLASAVWPDCRHAVVSLPDPKKGERLILVTDRARRRDRTAGRLRQDHRRAGAGGAAQDHPRAGDPGPRHRQDRLRGPAAHRRRGDAAGGVRFEVPPPPGEVARSAGGGYRSEIPLFGDIGWSLPLHGSPLTGFAGAPPEGEQLSVARCAGPCRRRPARSRAWPRSWSGADRRWPWMSSSVASRVMASDDSPGSSR